MNLNKDCYKTIKTFKGLKRRLPCFWLVAISCTLIDKCDSRRTLSRLLLSMIFTGCLHNNIIMLMPRDQRTTFIKVWLRDSEVEFREEWTKAKDLENIKCESKRLQSILVSC